MANGFEAIPPVDIEAQILRAQEEGRSYQNNFIPQRERTLNLKPTVRQRLLNALLGGAAGLEAAQKIPDTDFAPLAGLIQGAAAGYKAPAEYARKNSTLGEVAPRLAARFPGSETLTLEQAHSLLPLFKLYEQTSDKLTPEQLEAINSGNVEDLSRAFPQGIPRSAVALANTRDRQEDLGAERGYRRKERRSAELSTIVTKFNSDLSVKRAQQSIDGANTIRGLLDSNNPIAAAAVPTFMARASGEVGALTEADKAPFGGSRAIIARLKQAAVEAASGKLTEENALFVNELVGTMEKRANENIRNLAVKRSKQYAKASTFLDENDILSSLIPDYDSSKTPKETSTQGSGTKASLDSWADALAEKYKVP